MSNKSNILLKILIVVALILAGLVFYINKIIHEKPIHEEERVVVKSMVMPHPKLSDKSRSVDREDKEVIDDSNESEDYVKESNTTTVELTPDIPKDEVEVITNDSSLDEPEIVINDETEIIDDNADEDLAPIEEEPIFVDDKEEVDIIENDAPQEQISIKKSNIDLGRRIDSNEEKKQNIDLGVQLF